jgi:hypothetical protein
LGARSTSIPEVCRAFRLTPVNSLTAWAAAGTLWMSRELAFDNRDHRTHIQDRRDAIFCVCTKIQEIRASRYIFTTKSAAILWPAAVPSQLPTIVGTHRMRLYPPRGDVAGTVVNRHTCRRWMPRHEKPMKDVAACDKLRGGGKQPLIRRCPNGETHAERTRRTHA